MSRWLAIGFAGMLMSLASCSEAPSTPMRRVELPGFSVALPEGEVILSDDSPSTGKHSVKLPVPFFANAGLLAEQELEVAWANRSLPPKVWRETVLPSLAPLLSSGNPDARVLEERALGEDRWLYVVGTESAPVGIGVVNCDPNFGVTISYMRYQDRARLSRELEEIVSSARCAVGRANLAGSSPALNLPAKFGRIDHPWALAFRSLDGEYLAVSGASRMRTDDPQTLESISRAIITKIYGADFRDLAQVQDNAKKEDALLLRASRVNASPMYVGYLSCGSPATTFGIFWMAPEADDATARQRMRSIGCPGAPASTPREFKAVATEACTSGDSEACKLITDSATS